MKVNGFFVDIGEHGFGQRAHAGFGVAVRRRRVAVNRTKVTLTVYQHVTQVPALSHAHHGVVDGAVAVGVIFFHDLTHHRRRLGVFVVAKKTFLVHGVKNAPLHWFKPVTHIR